MVHVCAVALDARHTLLLTLPRDGLAITTTYAQASRRYQPHMHDTAQLVFDCLMERLHFALGADLVQVLLDMQVEFDILDLY